MQLFFSLVANYLPENSQDDNCSAICSVPVWISNDMSQIQSSILKSFFSFFILFYILTNSVLFFPFKHTHLPYKTHGTKRRGGAVVRNEAGRRKTGQQASRCRPECLSSVLKPTSHTFLKRSFPLFTTKTNFIFVAIFFAFIELFGGDPATVSLQVYKLGNANWIYKPKWFAFLWDCVAKYCETPSFQLAGLNCAGFFLVGFGIQMAVKKTEVWKFVE